MLNLNTHKIFYIILFLFVLIQLSNNSAIKQHDQKKYKKVSEKIGLYSLTDDVEILTVENFKQEIYGNERAWIIEFYNAWCGFCQRFAPSWQKFATDIKEWKNLVGVGAIDCSNDNNTSICREFEIMGYPTLKYFHEKYESSPTNFGEMVHAGGQSDAHRHKLLNIIIKEQVAGRGKMYPNLLPFVGNEVKDVFTSENSIAFLIIQNSEDFIGQEVIMDLNKMKHVNIRYALSNNTHLVNKLGILSYPALVALQRTDTFQTLQAKNKRRAYVTAIQHFLQSKVSNSISIEKYLGKGEDSSVPDLTDYLEERERKSLKDKIKKMGDVVFQMDLETTLRYSLKHEVASIKEIMGEKLQALKNYLNVLSKYFPFGLNGRIFLQELREFVWYKSSVKGTDIVKLLVNAENEDQLVFSSRQHWLGCKGSSVNYRGYPCGLWKLFHYLTVNAADYNEGITGSNHKVVLEAMHGYIKNFFGCLDCSEHFQDMAKKRAIFNVTSWNDSILWLWSAHNEVNTRLSGDETEDPEFPKRQFPSKERCPRCYNKDDSWNKSEVLYYIKHIYSSINIRYIGSDTRILHLGLDGTPIIKIETGIFKTIDTALCLILYLASFMLILVLIYMFLRRGYRKKIYHHDLLGKV